MNPFDSDWTYQNQPLIPPCLLSIILAKESSPSLLGITVAPTVPPPEKIF